MAPLSQELEPPANPGRFNKTGLVIAGYGDDEFFPSCIVYECWGVVLGKFIFKEKKGGQRATKACLTYFP